MDAPSTNLYYVPTEIPAEYCFDSNSTFSEYADVWIEENTSILAVKTISRYRDLLKRINIGIGIFRLKTYSRIICGNSLGRYPNTV